MLLSNVGVGDDVFMNLLRNMIINMGRMFVDDDEAAKALKPVASDTVSVLQSVRFRFTSDPHFRYMLMAIYRFLFLYAKPLDVFCRKQMKDLRERSRIRLNVDSGRVLIGILDETGILEYGEVFIQISKTIENPTIEKRIITSKVVIMKNPCLHPGDVRTFQSRDVPALHHLVDCVVFPRKGNRPHPNELSGSDLDGDQYHCIWDSQLIPLLPIREAMDYAPAVRKEESEPIGKSHMIEHTCRYIENDTLGIIDNAHKALADQLDGGIQNEICLKLAEVHALAVDAPKTGKWQSVPQEVKDELKRYPDFMMKSDKPSYPSTKVLGEIFRECNKYISDALDPSESRSRMRPRLDSAFKVEGYDEYIVAAYNYCKTYNAELLSIMQMYGIETEAEIVSGSISTVYSRLKSELDDVQENVQVLKQHLFQKYGKIFSEDPKLGIGDRKMEEKKKASAWYYVAYSPEYGDKYAIGRKL